MDATGASPPTTSDVSAAPVKEGEQAIPVALVGQGQGTDGQAQQQAYLVAPPNFAANFAPGQNITIQLPSNVAAPHAPHARVSNDPNNAFFTLDLSEDNTDLPLPLEEEGKFHSLVSTLSDRVAFDSHLFVISSRSFELQLQD